ncbi:S1C family serine protease [Georgenia deserti]|uniref:Trypsin-like peptidase domain-containing protein n=1 Tax=Georgenia deserti TaxID=2093781 RepID=A0ABW4L022_9MICO
MSSPDTNRPSGEPYPWSSPSAPRSWQSSSAPEQQSPYSATPYEAGQHQEAGDVHEANPHGANPHEAATPEAPQQPYGYAAYGSYPGYEQSQAEHTTAQYAYTRPGEHTGHQHSAKRRPGWPALVAVGAGAALLASLGTAGLTGAFDDAPASNQGQVQDPQDSSDSSAGPVVTSTTDDPDWANVADAVRPGVVAIQVQTSGGSGQGSGVVLDQDGNILTNNHVVGGAGDGGQIVVTLSDGRQFEAEVAGTDPTTDLAVITLVDAPDDLQPATMGSSEDVVVGDQVMAVGNPLGLSSTVTTGIVSALDRPVSTASSQQSPGQQAEPVVTNAIQVDAAINPGNSGGPLFDATGRVIGITSSIAGVPGASTSGSIGLGFAIPSDLASTVADQLIDKGVAEHAYLGVYLEDGTVETDGAHRTGAEVVRVESGTPASEAGLQQGDVITAIDDDTVSGAESLTGYVRQYSSGDQVTLSVVRDGEQIQVQTTLATREDG